MLTELLYFVRFVNSVKKLTLQRKQSKLQITKIQHIGDSDSPTPSLFTIQLTKLKPSKKSRLSSSLKKKHLKKDHPENLSQTNIKTRNLAKRKKAQNPKLSPNPGKKLNLKNSKTLKIKSSENKEISVVATEKRKKKSKTTTNLNRMVKIKKEMPAPLESERKMLLNSNAPIKSRMS